MANEQLTKQEKRNLEIVKEWAESYSTKGQWMKAVDEIYADTFEIYVPMENIYFARRGRSKENFRAYTEVLENFLEKREFRILNILARGDTVALEGEVTMTAPGGITLELLFASFLTFDDDHRIICEHSYHPPISPDQLPPDMQQAYKKMLEEEQ
jgi:ketosteroid isomerase-like protein